MYITKETVYQYYFLDNKVFSLHYFPNIWHPVYQFSFPSKLAKYYLKPNHIQACQQLQKFLYPLLPEGSDFNPSNIFGKETETSSLLTHPLTITFLPAFV